MAFGFVSFSDEKEVELAIRNAEGTEPEPQVKKVWQNKLKPIQNGRRHEALEIIERIKR